MPSTAEPSDHEKILSAANERCDAVATALEDVGFDVGREFPLLHGVVDPDLEPAIDLGRIKPEVAVRLIVVLTLAEARGITL
jgi:hypothetical protein